MKQQFLTLESAETDELEALRRKLPGAMDEVERGRLMGGTVARTALKRMQDRISELQKITEAQATKAKSEAELWQDTLHKPVNYELTTPSLFAIYGMGHQLSSQCLGDENLEWSWSGFTGILKAGAGYAKKAPALFNKAPALLKKGAGLLKYAAKPLQALGSKISGLKISSLSSLKFKIPAGVSYLGKAVSKDIGAVSNWLQKDEIGKAILSTAQDAAGNIIQSKFARAQAPALYNALPSGGAVEAPQAGGDDAPAMSPMPARVAGSSPLMPSGEQMPPQYAGEEQRDYSESAAPSYPETPPEMPPSAGEEEFEALLEKARAQGAAPSVETPPVEEPPVEEPPVEGAHEEEIPEPTPEDTLELRMDRAMKKVRKMRLHRA